MVVRRGTPKPQDVWTWWVRENGQSMLCKRSTTRLQSSEKGKKKKKPPLPTHLPNLQHNHRPRPLHPPPPHPPHPPLKPPLIPLHHPPPAKKPQDPRTPVERAEHDRHAPVLVDVGDGLAAGARGVDVGGRAGREDGEGGGGEAFGGDVDVLAC